MKEGVERGRASRLALPVSVRPRMRFERYARMTKLAAVIYTPLD